MHLFHLLESIPWVAGAVAAVATFILFAVAGLLLVRKTVKTSNLRAHHDVAGFVFANLGVLYSVLLGFTVVNVQQRFDKIKETSQIEASYLSELYHDAEVFAETERRAIRLAIKSYAESVVTEEWGAMTNGKPNIQTVKALRSIWKAYYNTNLSTKKQEIWYAESISKLNQLMSTRLTRLMGGEESLGSEMWTLLILGGIVMVSFIWFFGLESVLSHALMASILAASTAFLLFLIYSLDSAFSGTVSIPPDAMNRVLLSFDIT